MDALTVGRVPFRQRDRWGYCDRSREIKIAPQFDQAFPFYTPNVALVVSKRKQGLITRDGSLALPIEYDCIGNEDGSLLNPDGSISVMKDGRHGLVDPDGVIVVPPRYDRIQVGDLAAKAGWRGRVSPFDVPDGFSDETLARLERIGTFVDGLAPCQVEGRWGVVNASGAVVINAQYEKIEPFARGQAAFTLDGRSGLIDTSGRVVVPAQFDEIYPFSEGLAVAQNHGRWGAIRGDGSWAITPRFDELRDFFCARAVALSGEKRGFVDQTGHVLIPLQYDWAFDCMDDVCGVVTDGQLLFLSDNGRREQEAGTFIMEDEEFLTVARGPKWGVFRRNGSVVLPVAHEVPTRMGESFHPFSEARMPFRRGALCGYAAPDGSEPIKPKYVIARPFREQRAMVCILDPVYSRGETAETLLARGDLSGVFLFGFVDPSGNEIVPLKYRLARDFNAGLAFAETTNTLCGYIDRDGIEYFED